MAFKAIETQEELDSIVQQRLDRERAATEKKYAGFDAAVEKAKKYDELAAKNLEAEVERLNRELQGERVKAADHEKIVADLTERASKAETAALRVKTALAAGLPYEMADRLKGTTEAELQEDAKSLTAFVKTAGAPPLRTTEPAQNAGGQAQTMAAFQALAAALTDPAT